MLAPSLQGCHLPAPGCWPAYRILKTPPLCDANVSSVGITVIHGGVRWGITGGRTNCGHLKQPFGSLVRLLPLSPAPTSVSQSDHEKHQLRQELGVVSALLGVHTLDHKTWFVSCLPIPASCSLTPWEGAGGDSSGWVSASQTYLD